MPPEMDFYWISHSTHVFLSECDLELVKEALNFILNPRDEQSASPEAVQIAYALNNYLKECNNAFLASERIRLFLLLTLFASLLITFISLATLPISVISITSICILSIILFSVNLFTLYNQMAGYQQEINGNTLKRVCSDYAEKLYSANKSLKSISSPTSAPCLFPARKIPQNDEVNANIANERLNHPEHRLPPIDDESLETSIKFSGM